MTNVDQGWILVGLTSLITICGCCIIYTDEIYKALFPKRYAKKPFEISSNTNFLICSLSLSSGCLIFTSLYKLLPKSHQYLKQVPRFANDKRLLKITEFTFYFLGIITCSLLNVIIHIVTSESLVHCVHDSEDIGSEDQTTHLNHSHTHNDDGFDHQMKQIGMDDHDYGHVHKHKHHHSHMGNIPDNIDSAHSHSHSIITLEGIPEVADDYIDTTNGSLLSVPAKQNYLHNTVSKERSGTTAPVVSELVEGQEEENDNCNENGHINSEHNENGHINSEHNENVENNQGDKNGLKHKSISLMDLSLKALKGQTLEGKCYGDIDCCTDEIACQNKLHRHKNNQLHFCSKPSEENLLFFPDQDHMITKQSEIHSRFPDLNIKSPLITDDSNNKNPPDYNSIVSNNVPKTISNNILNSVPNNISNNTPNNTPSNISNSIPNSTSNPMLAHADAFTNSIDLEASSLDGDYENVESLHQLRSQHHHHIKTPLSRLLAIGLQTVLAITLHKFPEGFIMYSTSKANPELGLSIFLSMFIHNFVEGFTMTLPIYIALNSRIKALLISGTLGGSAQPIGALLGWFIFRRNMDMNDKFSLFLIGSLISLTSGFLTFIALQMFASAIGFGGKQEKVLKWSFFGIFLISCSYVLI